MTESYIYDTKFQDMTAAGSAYSARRIAEILQTITPIHAVLDVGCARGTWLRQWREQGVLDIVGLDGDYVDRARLEIDPGCFRVHDLSERFSLGRQFDLAQCLEVAEHLPPSRAPTLVDDLTAHAPVVLFSAAPPGQGGEHHINEQPAAYWQALFARRGFRAIDCLRPLLARDPRVSAWYRYNLVVYARHDALDRLCPFTRQFLVDEREALPDVSPTWYRARKRLITLLPQPVCDLLARWNARRHQAP